jgi:hypothetical protein
MSRRIWLCAGLGLVLSTGGASLASAANDVFDFKPAIAQGTTKFKGQTKYKAQGSVSFKTRVNGVSCTDSLSLERRVKQVSHGKTTFHWILIRGGMPERKCEADPKGPKPADERSVQSFLNSPGPYKHVLATTPIRLRYAIKVIVNGHLRFRKTLTTPVTAKTLSQSFRPTTS